MSEGHNDGLAVWVLKRSNHAEVIGLTSDWSVCVCVCVCVVCAGVCVLVCAPVSLIIYPNVCVGLFLSLSGSGGGPASVNVRNRNKPPNAFIHADRAESRKRAAGRKLVPSIFPLCV